MFATCQQGKFVCQSSKLNQHESSVQIYFQLQLIKAILLKDYSQSFLVINAGVTDPKKKPFFNPLVLKIRRRKNHAAQSQLLMVFLTLNLRQKSKL